MSELSFDGEEEEEEEEGGDSEGSEGANGGVSVAELSDFAHFSLQRRVWRLRLEETLKRRPQISHAQAGERRRRG